MKMLILVIFCLVALAMPAHAFEAHGQVTNGVIVITCDKLTGTMLSLKALVDIPAGTEMPLAGACEIRA